MVHRRELAGETLVFGNQGALWGNAMTWWDHDTGSIWSQPLGEAIAGPRKGERIEALPVTFTTWSTWLEAHPATLALDAPGGVTGFDLEELVIVVDLGVDAAAYPVVDVQRLGVINDVVAGVEIAVVSDPQDPQRWRVFSRRLDDRVVELEQRSGQIVDVATGTQWDVVSGVARQGPLVGDALNVLSGFTAFPGDFDTFWPEGRMWRP